MKFDTHDLILMTLHNKSCENEPQQVLITSETIHLGIYHLKSFLSDSFRMTSF